MSQSDETSASESRPNGVNDENEYVFVIQQESSAGQYNQYLFRRMFNRVELSDVILRCDGRDIPAHRIVLAAHSPFFVKQFEEKPTNGLVIVVDNVKFDVLLAAIQLMYHGTVSIEPQLEPALSELLKNFEMDGLMCNPIRVRANTVNKNVDKKVDNKKKVTAMTNVKEKKQCVEHEEDNQKVSEYDQFMLSIDEIIRTLTTENVDAKAADLLRQNIYTRERLVTIVNVMIRQVVSIASKTPTICYAKLSAAIKSHDVTGDGFSSILLNVCKAFFNANIERKLVRPDCSDAPTLNAFDQQIHTLQMIEYHYSHERLRRIVRFLSELYTQNVINGGLLLTIQEKEIENLSRGIHDYFFLLLAIFDTAGKMLSEEHPTYTNECVTKLKEQLTAMENNHILSDVKALIAQAIEMSETGWKNECREDIRLGRDPLNESLPNSDVEEHLYWIKNSVARQPAKLEYHLARNYGERNRERGRRSKQNVNKPERKNSKNLIDRNHMTNENRPNGARNTVAPRAASQREQLPIVKKKGTNHQQPVSQQNVASSTEPRNEANAESSTAKSTRRSRRRDKERYAKYIAEKAANNRK